MVKDMAQKIVLVDDLDGETEATHLLTFFKEGSEFELDLSTANFQKYNELLEAHAQLLDFLADHGRQVERAKKIAPKARTKADYDKIRDWARENGFPQVKDAGRIADHILKAYDNAVKASQTPVKTTEEVTEGGENGDLPQAPVEAPKPAGIPAPEFSATMGEVLSLDAPRKNAGKAKAGAK